MPLKAKIKNRKYLKTSEEKTIKNKHLFTRTIPTGICFTTPNACIFIMYNKYHKVKPLNKI